MRAGLGWLVALACLVPPAHAQVCGDQQRGGAEQCDDGNRYGGDGCSVDCRFEQAQRVNALAQAFATSAFCTQNRLGGAIAGSIAQGQFNNSLATGVQDGSISLVVPFSGLESLSGANDAALEVGILNATPVLPGATAFDGTNADDWWFRTALADLDADGLPLDRLPGSITGGVLTAGPGSAALRVSVAGTLSVLSASSVRFRTTVGASTTPAVSSGLPPGHLASENLDPALQSFGSMTGGEMCANVSAESLANTPIPAALIGCTIATCTQCYTATNTMLDLFVSGCTILVPQVQATQPDAVDPDAPVAGAGPPYTLQANPQRQVTGCLASGMPAPLDDCLRAAAYSTAFTLATERAIPRAPSPLVFADGFE